jgi:hypothetical protein
MGFSMSVTKRELEMALPLNRLSCPVNNCRGEIQPCGSHPFEVRRSNDRSLLIGSSCWVCTRCARHWLIGEVPNG